ncbi:alpha-ketoglutarate-dependent dioxygenase AlkB family protein [Arenimonas fontis]|uniref:Alpha-ketoglutarate-dependent dioxygenase AlkB n=1 Tax=Arenimonas fontis TaxID=2608255 RepID=A0A5B2ZE07_9GAMM|nr:alpha-ketoglutarate-dependent dioxygenase AlkB [Arenimonas fontis]KAA2285474.1 alpha-ketoglutarate-dependent dioxygenase AlkB [Arenimonas fontis]
MLPARFERLPLPDGRLHFVAGWLGAEEADALFEGLSAQVPWEVHRIRLFGREVESPRLSCWIGDSGASYVYSRTRFEPRPWLPALQELRLRLERETGARFNSVLANLYRDGADAMGWHADDEPELGARPVIASVSLGATRRFLLRHRRERGRRLALELPHGSLLLMSGDTQANWQHALARTVRPVGPRINLTFRWIRGTAAPA